MLTRLLLFVSLLAACMRPQKDEVIIKGYIKDLPGKYIYLFGPPNRDIPFDSAVNNNGNFEFHIDATGYEPEVISLCIMEGTRKRSFLFNNREDTTTSYAGFIAEPGVTNITGTFKQYPAGYLDKLDIEYGQDTKFLFSGKMAGFGQLSKDSAARNRQLAQYKKIASTYPGSFYLFNQMFYQRERFSNRELKELAALFNEKVRHSSKGRLIDTLLQFRSEVPVVQNRQLLTPDGQPALLIDTTATANLVIFWASWCGPCREEIPMVKTIHSELGKKGLNIVSVSIDKVREDWMLALQQEKMDWKQLWVEPALQQEVKSFYNFSAIPLLLLTDSNGNILRRFEGYNKENEQIIKSIFVAKEKRFEQ